MYKEIRSTKNPLIKSRRALSAAKARREEGLFLVEGSVLLEEALRSPLAVREIFCDENLLDASAALLEKSASQGAEIYTVSPEVLSALADTVTPQGIVATVSIPALPAREALGHRLVFLEDVQDPGNAGTLLRSALAFGFTAAVLTGKCADPFAPKTIRSAMGAAFQLPLLTGQSAGTLSSLSQAGFQIIGTVMDGAPIQDCAFREPFCLLVGNEARGMSETARAICDTLITLPMKNGVQSLNAAIAGSICMFYLS